MSYSELADWMIYYSIEPFPEERADLRAGIIASTLANVHRSKNGKVFKPEDFIPEYIEKKKESPESLVNKMNTLKTLFGGKK